MTSADDLAKVAAAAAALRTATVKRVAAEHEWRLAIFVALDAGAHVKDVAFNAGVTPRRITQIRTEGRPEIT